MATVHDLTLSLPDIEFHLEHGVIYRMVPVGGKITGLYYEGKGTAVFTPSDSIAAQWLGQITGDVIEESAFDRLFCRFADWKRLSFSRPLAFTPVLHPPRPTRFRHRPERWLARYLVPDRFESQSSRVAPYIEIFRDLTRHRQPGSFYATFGSGKFPRVNDRYYCYEPRNNEPIVYNGWCRYAAQSGPGIARMGPKFDVNPVWFDIEANISPPGKVRFQIEGRYTVLDSVLSHVFLDLASSFTVHSVADGHNHLLTFWKGRNEHDFPGILVFLDREYYRGDTLVLRFNYSGEPKVTPQGDVYYFPKGLNWYPTTGSFCNTAFDARFDCPDNWLVIASGRKIKEYSRVAGTYSYWVLPEGAANFSFTFGAFRSKKYFFDGIPPVTVFAARAAVDGLTFDETFNKVAADILNALSYFRRIFGPYPFTNLALVELPIEGEVAFPGLVFQPPEVFEARLGNAAEARRGEGVAKQWWGHLVREQSYHDRWFIEGVAEYASALYTQKSRKRDDIFRRVMRAWREDILAADSPPTPQPLWRGAGASPASWRAKSAWVIHMLRMMMMDLDIGTDRRFIAMLRDFLEYYRGREVTTRDFQHQAELYYGEPMDWFFQQWVYSTGIPTYKYRHRLERPNDGQYLVHLEVEQLGVGPDFKMPVPVSVTFRGGRPHHERIWVSGPHTAVTLGPFETKPKQIIFNDFDGVLARSSRASNRIADTDSSP